MPPTSMPMPSNLDMPTGGEEDADEEQQYPQFQVILNTTEQPFTIAQSDTVNDLVDRAKAFMGTTDAIASLPDSSMKSITLQEMDPDSGAYVDQQELPVESKQDVIGEVRKLGAR